MIMSGYKDCIPLLCYHIDQVNRLIEQSVLAVLFGSASCPISEVLLYQSIGVDSDNEENNKISEVIPIPDTVISDYFTNSCNANCLSNNPVGSSLFLKKLVGLYPAALSYLKVILDKAVEYQFPENIESELYQKERQTLNKYFTDYVKSLRDLF